MARNWDDVKNQINQRRHGFSFETAWLVFDDPLAVRTAKCGIKLSALLKAC